MNFSFSKNLSRFCLVALLIFQALWVFSPHVVYAQSASSGTVSSGGSRAEQSIRSYLCTPTDPVNSNVNTTLTTNGYLTADSAASNNSGSHDLFRCINKLYKTSIAVGAMVAMFFVVFAGYMYMSAGANQKMVDSAKDMIKTSIVGMALLLTVYLFLQQINPDIVKFRNIQPPNVVTDDLSGIKPGTGGNVSSYGAVTGGTSYKYTGIAGGHKPSEITNTGGCEFQGGARAQTELPQINSDMFAVLLNICNQAKGRNPKLSISALTGCNGGATCQNHASTSLHYRGCAVDFGDDPVSSNGNGKFIIDIAQKAGLRVNPGSDAEQNNHTHIDLGNNCKEASK